MLAAELRELLALDLTPVMQRLNVALLDRLATDAEAWLARRQLMPDSDAPVVTLLEFCKDELRRFERERDELEAAWRQFDERNRHAHGDEELARHVIEFAAALGASAATLANDRRALSRWLDRDAIVERYRKHLHDEERLIVFVLERIGSLAERHMRDSDPVACWQRLQLEPLLLPVMSFDGDPRVKTAGFSCLSRTLRQHPAAGQAIAAATAQYVFRFALDARQPLWLQCEAMDLVATIAPERCAHIVRERLADPLGSDLFLRRRLVSILATHSSTRADHSDHSDCADLLSALAEDTSDAVRQAVADALPQLPAALMATLAVRLADDRAAPVAAAVAVVLPSLAAIPAGAQTDDTLVATLLTRLLSAHGDPFVLRATMHVLPALTAAVSNSGLPAAAALRADIDALLTMLHTTHTDTAVRRRAAQARERLFFADAAPAQQDAVHALGTLRAGERSARSDGGVDDTLFARLLAVQAQQDFGFDIGKKRVRREFRPVVRLWRFLHEFRSPATGKRQNTSHIAGRAWDELLQAPSQCVAEMSATRVPGEPLHIAEEGGWRPWLPLVDQVISCLDQGWPTQPLRIVTAEGTTLLTPPDGFVARLRARWLLTRDFAEYARLRNWTAESTHAPDAYLAALVTLGFRVSLATHPGADGTPWPRDERVTRFFPAFVLPTGFAAQWQSAEDYFYSVYQNTLTQLLVFCVGIAALFIGNHLWRNVRLRRARRRIPLVIGGWGTRGKSGTERLKAALFSALGNSVVAKTTGCEAMFLHGSANRPLREMFLYRPYDKATIWEQAETTVLAADLEAEVFLWECMALNPRYVQILQHQWMRDDLSTITNCFPDHEDIQGPAGVDIPQVMTLFVPQNAVLLTSEENMLPYLAHAARAEGTRLVTTGWLDAGLLTGDILARFPYREHPYNVALVLALARELGIPRDFALAEMAARVVPDLGVLKIFPAARLDGRMLEFINGMSANERLSSLENWQRTGMDKYTLQADPGIWLATVINNRDDRVARSQVFAEVLVNDIAADRHVLIGSNLDGLRAYINTALNTLLGQLTADTPATELQRLADTLATRFRVPADAETAQQRLAAMLAGSGIDETTVDVTTPDALADSAALAALSPAHREQILAQFRRDLADVSTRRTLNEALAGSALTSSQRLTILRDTARGWLASRIVVLDDEKATGNDVVAALAAQVPPGLTGRIMGMQNIKGTGLDFVYRWQAWERVARLCGDLANAATSKAADAAHDLARVRDFGLLDEEAVRAALVAARARTDLQTAVVRNDLELAANQLERQLSTIRAATVRKSRANTWLALVDFAEHFLDAGSAVKRRRIASQVYKDLAACRISHERAALVLMQLNREQAGGWLREKLGAK